MTDRKETASAEMIKRLWSTDLSLVIKLAGGILPNVFDNLVADFSEKQKKAIDKVLPPGGKKKLYIKLVGSPTQPIVVGMAQPISITTMSERDIENQKIKGLKLELDDIMPLTKGQTLGNMLKVVWRFRGQMSTLISIGWSFMPILRLGRANLEDMKSKMTSKMEPLRKLMN
ncbi:hypothetical protein ACFLT3_00860 [Chloroflexota bacterium]